MTYTDATENEKKATMKQGAGESTTKQKKKDNNMLVNQKENTEYDKETKDVDNGLNMVLVEVIEAEEELRADKQKAREQETEHWTEDKETKKPSNLTSKKQTVKAATSVTKAAGNVAGTEAGR
eukprot:10883397-Ditylum_brightwellii.AAC.1